MGLETDHSLVGKFLTKLDIEELSQDHWKLLNPLIYASECLTYPGELVTVPTGFETDLESIPRWLPLAYAVLYGSAHPASVVHDWLYTQGAYNRKTDDAVLYEAILAAGEPRWKSFIIWMGVRIGGGPAWQTHRRAERSSL